jgi:parallel beta-helix repeat protein
MNRSKLQLAAGSRDNRQAGCLPYTHDINPNNHQPMRIKIPSLCAVVIVAFAFHPSFLRGQGSLTPPGAPAPTMKSLDQIEPRTPVDATHTPGNGIALFAITNPGSYYLTGNIVGAAKMHGISIQTNDVTLDLNGFQMLGGSGSLYGIFASASALNIVIRNGTLRNWEYGVLAGNGYCEVDHVRAYACQTDGFHLGDYCAVKNCSAGDNAGTGVEIGNGCVVTDCLVSTNVLAGISGGSDCLISGCQARANPGDGFALGDHCTFKICTAVNNGGTGIMVSSGCVLTDCLVSSNVTGISGGSDCLMSGCLAITNMFDGIDLAGSFTVSKCRSSFNGFNGFTLGTNGQIRECVADTNFFDGIVVEEGCTVAQCIASANGSGIAVASDCVVMDNHASGNQQYGILTVGTGSRIDNNQASNNGLTGISSQEGGGADVIIRNTSLLNGAGEYFPTFGTTFGPFGSPYNATSPWANF